MLAMEAGGAGTAAIKEKYSVVAIELTLH